MKRLSFRKRLSCSLVAMLSLFAVCGTGLHAEEITYYRGAMDGPPEVQTVEKDVAIVVSDMGINVPGYVIIGWHEVNIPMIVNTPAMENALMGMAQFHAIGSSFTVTRDMTLHAIWARDADGNGYPDYGGIIVRPKYNKELIERMISKVDFGGDDGLLRSAPSWDFGYDLPAFNDSIYYVGCMYNVDPENQIWENLIFMNPLYVFNGKGETTVALKKMNLVIEYDGVLEEGSMIGGPTFRPLTTIEITQDMVNNEYPLESLLNDYPFMFNAIKEDGQGILRMWFEVADESDANYGKKPDVTSGTYFGVKGGGIWGGGAWGTQPGSKGNEAFLNPETGAPDSIFRIKFNIYNKPAFASNVISQKVDSDDRIDLKLMSGTPIKYMMRCINDFRWRPADAPLTKAEREEIWSEGATICLREMDKTIGHQMFLKEFYFTDGFPPDGNPLTNDYYQDFLDFSNEKMYIYNDSALAYYRMNEPGAYSPVGFEPFMSSGYCAVEEWYSFLSLGTPLPATPPAIGTPAADVHYGFLGGALAAASGTFFSPYPSAGTLAAIADARATADWYTVYAPRKAAAIPVPDPCRGTFCLSFESRPQPGIQREIFIPQTAGVTTNPEYGTTYVNSQDDFFFTAKYTTAQPLKVTTNRIVDGIEEELVGTPNEAGGYDYVIRKVAQNIVLTFGPDFAMDNESIDGRAVWSYDNMINIRVAKEDIASIYSIAGQMVKRIELSEGDNPVPMERGVYIVTLKDGSVHKVVVK